VVRRSNDDRVDIFLVKEPAKIMMEGGLAANLFLGGYPIGLIHVAQGHDVGIFVDHERVEQLITAVANADEAESNTIIAAQRPGSGCFKGG
jgi:hypothetical protein